jgi:hypothetical protein
MTSIQRLAFLGLAVFSTVAMAQQTPANPPPSTPGSQTTTTTTTTQDPSVPRRDQDPIVVAPLHDQMDAPLPLTKRELKEQRRRQKQEEKSARAHAEATKHSAKADKENAKAMEQRNKAANAAQDANTPQ